jgi:hypothetical protein
MQGERLLRGSGMSQQVGQPSWKPYHRFGDKSWDPAALGPIPTVEQEREARAAEFARLRESGLGVYASAAAVGLANATGRLYERERKHRAGLR